jgi:hypothetical protein
VFEGTPPAKPLDGKSVSIRFGAHFGRRRADPTGRKFSFLRAIFNMSLPDII